MPHQIADLNAPGEPPAPEPPPATAPTKPSANALTEASAKAAEASAAEASARAAEAATETSAKTAEASAQTPAEATAMAPLTSPELAALIEKIVEVSLAPALQRINETMANASHKDALLEKMHGELQAHRENLVAQATLPLKKGLIRLYASLSATLDFYRKNGRQALDPDRAMSLLEGLQTQVEIVLGDGGVTTYRAEGERFEPRRQRASRTTPTAEPTQVGAIAERVSPGFESDGRILEKESVTVFVPDPNPPQGSPK